jgi:hypothetical protein
MANTNVPVEAINQLEATKKQKVVYQEAVARFKQRNVRAGGSAINQDLFREVAKEYTKWLNDWIMVASANLATGWLQNGNWSASVADGCRTFLETAALHHELVIPLAAEVNLASKDFYPDADSYRDLCKVVLECDPEAWTKLEPVLVAAKILTPAEPRSSKAVTTPVGTPSSAVDGHVLAAVSDSRTSGPAAASDTPARALASGSDPPPPAIRTGEPAVHDGAAGGKGTRGERASEIRRPGWLVPGASLSVAFAVVGGIAFGVHKCQPPERDTLQACIHDSLKKETTLTDDTIAKLVDDIAAHATPLDAGDVSADPAGGGISISGHTISKESFQTMSGENVAKVIETCGARFNVAPPDANVTINVVSGGAPISGVYVWNMGDKGENCTTEKPSGSCSLTLHRIRHDGDYHFDATFARYAADAGNGVPFASLSKGVVLTLHPIAKMLNVLLKGPDDASLPGVRIIAKNPEQAFRNDQCLRDGDTSLECATTITDPEGNAVFYYMDPFTALDVVVSYKGKSKILFRRDPSAPFPANLELHWSDQAVGLQGAGTASSVVRRACSPGEQNVILRALRSRASPMPNTPTTSVALHIQIDNGGNVASVAGDSANPLLATAQRALTSSPIDVHGCNATVSWVWPPGLDSPPDVPSQAERASKK